jgi:cell division protein FtsX
MKGFLVVLVLLVTCGVGLGFYLGWFRLSADREGQKTNVTISVDQEKIRKDEEKAKEKVQQAGQKVKERTGAGTQKSKDETPQP